LILKSYIIEQNNKVLNDYNSILLYGENKGLIDDLKNIIKKINPSYEIINFFQEDLNGKEKILLNEINNTSLFSENKLIILHETSDKIFSQLEAIFAEPISNLKIVVLSNLLDKKSKMRNMYEKDKNLAVIPCYADNERSLSFYVNKRLREVKGANQEITNLIINNSNYDRKTISNELNKIESYSSKKPINYNVVEELINIKSDTNFSEIRDASLVGDKKKVNKLLGEVEFRNEDLFFYLNSLNNRVLRLYEIFSLNENINDLELTLETLKPKVFWKDKPKLTEQLKKWNAIRLQKVLKKVSKLELDFKTNNNRNDIVFKRLLVNLCQEASNF
tara:strand:+ start:310 stop:1308 length:999 start_codon:yes stop_codon:yes gene_type:complete